jgi:hypothetical protein
MQKIFNNYTRNKLKIVFLVLYYDTQIWVKTITIIILKKNRVSKWSELLHTSNWSKPSSNRPWKNYFESCQYPKCQWSSFNLLGGNWIYPCDQWSLPAFWCRPWLYFGTVMLAIFIYACCINFSPNRLKVKKNIQRNRKVKILTNYQTYYNAFKIHVKL